MTVPEIIHEWQAVRRNTGEALVPEVDARYATSVGLPVLAALHRLVAQLARSHAYVSSAEIMSEVRAIIRLATGEGERRADRAGCRIELPGLIAAPSGPLLEDLIDRRRE